MNQKETRFTPRQGFLRGAKAGVPVVLGFIPVGIAYAIMAREAGFGILECCLGSVLVFAGASQMMAVGMIAQGASVVAILVATFMINLRHVIMSTCVASGMEGGRLPLRLLLAFGVTDESFAIFTLRQKFDRTPCFFAGLVCVTYASWNVGTLLGALSSDLLPDAVSSALGIALYAMFLGLICPSLRINPRLLFPIALTALCNSLLCLVLDSSWAVICSTLLCAFIGVFFVDPDGKKEVDRAE